MTRLFTKTLLTAGLSAVLGSLTLTAQNRALVADIPFAFHAQGKVLPAGRYEMKERTASGVFQMSNSAAKYSQFVSAPVPKHSNPSESKLTFAKYGSEYILSEISVAGTRNTNAVTPAGIEKNLTRKLGLSALISVPLHAR